MKQGGETRHMTDDLLNGIAEKIAISSIRYYMIKHDLNKIITFDIIESLSLEGDTGPYLHTSMHDPNEL